MIFIVIGAMVKALDAMSDNVGSKPASNYFMQNY